MTWKIENNLKRILNVFKRSKSQIFPEDIEALKNVSSALEDAGRAKMNDDLLFAKLLCYVLNQKLHHYGDMKQSIAEISRILKLPVNYHVSILSENLNNQELNNYFKTLGINFDSYNSESEKVNNNQNEIIEKIKSNWMYEKVEKSFVKTVNEFLTDIDNYI